MALALARRSFRFVLAVSLLTARAYAQLSSPGAPATVEVRAPSCIERPYDRAHLVELLRVELTAVGVSEVIIALPLPRESGATVLPLAEVELAPDTCVPDTREVTLRVVDHATRKTVERRMLIADIPVAERPRALAIGIAELLQASWAEAALAAPPVPVALPPAVEGRLALSMRPLPAGAEITARIQEAATDTAARVQAAAEQRARDDRASSDARAQARRRVAFELRAGARAFPSRATGLVDAAGGLRFRPGPHSVFHAGADAAIGETTVSAGSVGVRTVTADARVAWVSEGDTELQLGPRLMVGYGWATGNPSGADFRGRTYGNLLAVATLDATVLFHGSSGWTGLVGVEGGYTLSSVSFLVSSGTGAERIAGLGGAVVGISAGIAFGL